MGRIKKILILSVLIIVSAAVLRTCTKRSLKQQTPIATESKNTPLSSHEHSTRWSFFDWLFTTSDRNKSQTESEEIVDESKEGPLRSELNIISERLENEEKLPESIWYPNTTQKEDVERHTALLRELIMLGNIVRNGTATSEQRERYYEIKLKIIQEKLELIKEYRERYKEFADPEDKGEEMVKLLENEIAKIKNEMKNR
ncbi:MAG: hypothetical protein N2316_02715 [Spirochaetes bacterium]|nr:hypothetical protein [Spirochaetota bacterium]